VQTLYPDAGSPELRRDLSDLARRCGG